MKEIERLLMENKLWAQEKLQANPEYFNQLASDQRPKFMWIGCSDSRVHPNEITGAIPGEIFVARNVANLVLHADLNLMSVLEYAINTLMVKHVIICGHYGCGGVLAALSRRDLGTINKWIVNIKDVVHASWEELKPLGEKERATRLVDLNVLAQVKKLTQTDVVQNAWSQGRELYLHGWVYGLNDGIIKRLVTIERGHQIDPAYIFAKT